jgi:glycerol-3-phosphate dehydrogenase (NAD(P)+)
MNTEFKKVAIVGAGSWGTALASVLAERGCEVKLYGRDQQRMSEMEKQRCNQTYLPHLKLADAIECVADIKKIDGADLVLMVVPSQHYSQTLLQIKQECPRLGEKTWLSCAKGVEISSGKRMSELIETVFPHAEVGILTGPNHAEEVSQKLATAAVIAMKDLERAAVVQRLMTLSWLRTYTTDDRVGVEWAAALKNPYAIAAGLARGLQLGDNAIAALVTRTLAEMVRFGIACGAQVNTFYGLAGLGDLMTTCFSEHSRNHRVGYRLARGESLATIVSSTKMIAEGVSNTLSLYQRSVKDHLSTPILKEVHAVLYEQKAPKLALQDLLSRDPRPEKD